MARYIALCLRHQALVALAGTSSNASHLTHYTVYNMIYAFSGHHVIYWQAVPEEQCNHYPG